MGFFDLEEETNSLYSSCLLFAGAGNWLKNGNATEKYGNGIVTADEISRMDCRNVELVVLSACFGGMNDARFWQRVFAEWWAVLPRRE